MDLLLCWANPTNMALCTMPVPMSRGMKAEHTRVSCQLKRKASSMDSTTVLKALINVLRWAPVACRGRVKG